MNHLGLHVSQNIDQGLFIAGSQNECDIDDKRIMQHYNADQIRSKMM